MLDLERSVPVHGSREVIALLEKSLAKAREGNHNYVTVTLCEQAGIWVDFAGTIDMEYQVMHALDSLKLKMESRIDSRRPPFIDESAAADTWSYNLGNSPASFDFIPWVIGAEMTRRRESAPGPLKVSFTLGKDGKQGLEGHYRSQMFVGVVRPALYMLGGVEHSGVGRIKEMFTTREIVAHARTGERVPQFMASKPARRQVRELLGDDRPVTITLREAEHWPHRNSNTAEWIKFAHHLKDRGENVIFVRDTAKANDVFPCPTLPGASIDLDIRLALYERAKCNFFVPNGPWSLASFTAVPYIMPIQLDAKDIFPPYHPDFWEKHQGIVEGEQFPWATTQQRIVWNARDDYKMLCEAWEAFDG